MATRELILGLSICDRSVQAAEMEQDGASNTLQAIDEWDNTFPARGLDDARGTDRFLEYLSAFIKVNRVRATKVSIALDTASLFINSFPLEDGVSRPDINEHVNWELSQFFPDLPAKEFVTDVHVMAHHPEEHWKRVLSVSVRRRDAYALQSALARLGLSVHILDVDHFSADHALRINYPDAERRHIALIGVKENRLDISFLRS